MQLSPGWLIWWPILTRQTDETRVSGQTLTELIAQKDAIALKIHLYKDIVYTGSQSCLSGKKYRNQSEVGDFGCRLAGGN